MMNEMKYGRSALLALLLLCLTIFVLAVPPQASETHASSTR